MSASTTMRWPKLPKMGRLLVCQPSNNNNSPSLRPRQKAPNHPPQHQHMTAMLSAITPNYEFLQMQVQARLDHLWNRKHRYRRKRRPIRSVTLKLRSMR